MKIKHQLATFNALTRLLIILVLWLVLPLLVEKVVYKNIDKNLIEKKAKFISHLDRQEINDFIVRNDTTETYASFSTLHNEFLQLSRISAKPQKAKSIFINEPREIESEQNDYRILQYTFTYDNANYLLEIGSSLAEIKDLIFIIRMFVLVLLVSIVIMTFVLDTFYIDRLLKPFYRIVDTKIRRVNEPDAFDHKPIVSRTSDFRELDSVLSQMMDRIQLVFKKEKQFIGNVSHELLTPIALLKNRFENLLQNPSLDDEAVDKIAASLRTLDILRKIINNLLLISRIENNQYEANETVDFKLLLPILAEELEDRIEEKELMLSINLEHDFTFKGNATLMHMLFYNLLTNAIKYNVPKGSIVISDGFHGSDYFISVADSGLGMDAAHLSKIFDRFTRINANQEGQGIGLAIADSIAQFHHIKLEVISELHQGSTFTLVFPEA
jgi:signal transduction histidine kinase